MAYKTLEKLFYADSSSDRYACHDELYCASALLPTARCGLEFTLSMVNCSLVFL